MSIAGIGAIGLEPLGEISPAQPMRRVIGQRSLMVRPIGAGRAVAPRLPDSTKSPEISRTAPEGKRQVKGTAYQTNADGDSATFASKLNQLQPEERETRNKLRQRDSHVRAHEQAHLASAGGLASGRPTFDYQTGPDGERYAIGGHVQIDSSPGSSPEETIAKARKIRAAALAPSDPSAQDMAVAAKAARMEAQARREMAKFDRIGLTPHAAGRSSGGLRRSSGTMLDVVA